MKLNLNKPIVFFDLETTGTDVARDHIVELCYIKIYPCGNEKTQSMRIRPVDAFGNTVHIPEQASAIHGIYDEKHAEDIKLTKTRVAQGVKVIELKRRNDVISHLSVVPRADDEEVEQPADGEAPEDGQTPAPETPVEN